MASVKLPAIAMLLNPADTLVFLSLLNFKILFSIADCFRLEHFQNIGLLSFHTLCLCLHFLADFGFCTHLLLFCIIPRTHLRPLPSLLSL